MSGRPIRQNSAVGAKERPEETKDTKGTWFCANQKENEKAEEKPQLSFSKPTDEVCWQDAGWKPWGGDWTGTSLHLMAWNGDNKSMAAWERELTPEVINNNSAKSRHPDGFDILG